MTELSIHELSLGFSHDRQMLVEFLAKHHLNYEDDIEDKMLSEVSCPDLSKTGLRQGITISS